MDFEKALVSYIKEANEAIPRLKEKTEIDIEPYDVQQALAEKLSVKDEYELLEKGLTKDQIVEYLSDFNF